MSAGRIFLGVAWLAGACAALPAVAAETPNGERGRRLYENHCVVCHTSKVHRRIPPMPIDLKDLRVIVSSWAREEKLGWTPDDVEDVVTYLDRTFYRMGR